LQQPDTLVSTPRRQVPTGFTCVALSTGVDRSANPSASSGSISRCGRDRRRPAQNYFGGAALEPDVAAMPVTSCVGVRFPINMGECHSPPSRTRITA
jgi:hypothetical protein